MNSYYLLFSFAFIQSMIILFLFRYRRSLVYPPLFVQLWWSIQILFALIFVNYDYVYSGIIFITCSLFLFSIGGFLATALFEKKEIVKNVSKKKFNEKNGMIALKVSVFLGCLFTIDFLIRNGFQLSQLLNFNSLLDLNNSTAQQRYYGETNSAFISKILLVFTYFSPLIGGMQLFYSNNLKNRLISILALLPAFLTIMTQNTKSGWLAALFLFTTGYVVANINEHGAFKFNIKYLTYGLIAIIICLGIAYLSMLMRIGSFEISTVKLVNEKFMVYAFGHISAFDTWFGSMPIIDYSYGIKTFYGLADFFGISTREQGVFTNFIFIGHFATNVYTVFRGLVEDFGIFGSGVTIFLYGFVSTLSYELIVKRRVETLNIFILAGFYFMCMYSFIISSWSYMSFVIAIVLTIPYCLFVFKPILIIGADKRV